MWSAQHEKAGQCAEWWDFGRSLKCAHGNTFLLQFLIQVQLNQLITLHYPDVMALIRVVVKCEGGLYACFGSCQLIRHRTQTPVGTFMCVHVHTHKWSHTQAQKCACKCGDTHKLSHIIFQNKLVFPLSPIFLAKGLWNSREPLWCCWQPKSQ